MGLVKITFFRWVRGTSQKIRYTKYSFKINNKVGGSSASYSSSPDSNRVLRQDVPWQVRLTILRNIVNPIFCTHMLDRGLPCSCRKSVWAIEVLLAAASFLLVAKHDRYSSSPIQWVPIHFQAMPESADTPEMHVWSAAALLGGILMSVWDRFPATDFKRQLYRNTFKLVVFWGTLYNAKIMRSPTDAIHWAVQWFL